MLFIFIILRKGTRYEKENDDDKFKIVNLGNLNNFDVSLNITSLGRYVLKVKVTNNDNITTEKQVIYSGIKKIDKPTSGMCLNKTYNGTSQVIINSGEGYTFNNNTYTDAGSHQVIASLNEGYMWNDGTQDDVKI